VIREIKAIIRVDRLSSVVHALRQISGMSGVTVSLVHGYGRSHPDHPGHAEPIAEAQFAKVETVVPAGLVDTVVNTIQRAAHTGRSGDGKIFVIPVQSVTRISTAEEGEQAI
jgi:nitrogen regulatory protein P-II 1